MRKVHRRAIIRLASMMAACCVCSFALDASLEVSQYAHAAWRVREGFSKGSIYVSDAGIGCALEQLGKSGGLGVINMRERVLQLNGTFQFDSAPGRGTTVKATVPFRPAP